MLDDKLIGARKVRERYNDVSEMSLWRWLHDDTLAFPHPIYINGRRFWKVSQLEAWERARAAAA
jgi:hypothetical protein